MYIAAIDKDLYVFGGRKIYPHSTLTNVDSDLTNHVHKLTKTSVKHFVHRKISFKSRTRSAPSPRRHHTGWEYAGNLWVFGGDALIPDGYLNNHGDFVDNRTNQLLCFDPSSTKWTNPKCSGSVPCPREKHSTAASGDKAWSFGGCSKNVVFDELFELNMCSLVWAQIQIDQPKPRGRYFSFLNATSDSKLVLHGGHKTTKVAFFCTWVLDLPSLTWKRKLQVRDHMRCRHAASPGLNKDIIIIGGYNGKVDQNATYTTTFRIKLEPKSLQQLAMQSVYNHHDILPWQFLPEKLIGLLHLSKAKRCEVNLSCIGCTPC